MHVFIDTNIFLLFYNSSQYDLEELDKLRMLLREGKIKLWLPVQVREELRRNRESVISTAIKALKEQRLDFSFPAMSKEYAEHEKLRKLQREYSQHHSQLVEQITKDATSSNLKADKTIRSLIDVSTEIEITDEIHRRAKQRHERGNPPGKSNSLGDAINWEALLSAVPKSEPFYVITDDRDYASELTKGEINPFLSYEWKNSKDAKSKLYNTLSSFFAEHYPNIQFAPEQERALLVRELVNSSNFAQTHLAIASLRRFEEFTAAQRNEIVTAALTNNQISWIAKDKDVKDFLKSIINDNEETIDSKSLEALETLFDETDESEST